ncbi:ABC transporter substrate-binding protein [Pseudoclavibacter sp. RFBA6]|uniref:ABC transporter substrate-binding protein n=1 Tax=Pseudoclavibacter sp. RFBA6 TaxID=2080573 RepID=UPI000CE9174C|nr:ABC transporter substrate-binding protein [Pseudoclavibacter sp. RFBA6]PPG38118.1 ABC transporter substrate-binding protein [Pseudoclavibacter sp. RFBA6]
MSSKRVQVPSRRAAALAAVAAVTLTMSACAPPGGGSSGGGEGDVVLGLLAPLTGGSAADGALMEQGARLAVDELNAAGGIEGRTVTLEVADVKDQSADAVASAVNSLTANPDVAAVLTGYASTTNFEIDLMAEAGMPYIIGGGSDQTAAIISEDPEAYPTVWSLTPSYAGYGTDFPSKVAAWNEDGSFPLRNETVYIISSDNPYSNGIASGLSETFESDGWNVVGPDTVPFGEVNDWTTQITKIKEADPSVIVNTDYQTANAASFLSQFVANPTDSLVFSQYAPSVPEFIDLAGSAANGVLYNLPISPLKTTPEGEAAIAAFDEAYGTDPGLYGIMLYESVRLWADAAEAAGDPGDREAVGAAIGDLDVVTSLGRVHFDPATHLTVAGDDGIPMIYFQIQDEQRVSIAPDEAAETSFTVPPWMQ